MRPASVRPRQSPFVKPRKQDKDTRLGLDMEKIEPLGENHKFNNQLNDQMLASLRQELILAQELGRENKAKKLRREINSLLEHNLGIRATWCRGCLRYLHLCRCPGLEALGYSRSTAYRRRKKAQANEQIIRQIVSQPLTGKELRRLRRERKEAG